MPRTQSNLMLIALIAGSLSIGCIGASLAALPEPTLTVSQKGKRFGPKDVTLRTGDRIAIVNDDGTWIHHAYIDAPDLKYDAGDIEPGAQAVIAFPNQGDFTVLCGIHPNMRLGVQVR